jgi:hypothetical protein
MVMAPFVGAHVCRASSRDPLTAALRPFPQACGCPLYWKGPLFYGAGGDRTGSVSVHKFVAMWRK